MPKAEMLALTPDQRQQLQNTMHSAASKGIGFFYGSYMLTLSRREVATEHLIYLYEILDYFNSADILAFVSRGSGRDDLRSADGQVTL
jgi:hypothetical protein